MIKRFLDMRANVYLRYVTVSFGALAVDLCIFLTLLSVGIASVAASAIGYSVGILAHWVLSSRKVFKERVSERGTAARTQQKAMFVISALLGLVVTIGIVAGGDAINVDPRISKLMAVAVAFQLTYLLRNLIIFRSPLAN